MFVQKVVECRTLLESLFFVKEELLKGMTFSTSMRVDIRAPEELKLLMGHDRFIWLTDDGTAYTLDKNKYYDDSMFREIEQLSTEKYFQFILDNAEKIDKLYKLKAFI